MGLETDHEYLVRRISPRETVGQLEAFPRYFEIETVNACNAKCPMCTIADWNRKDGVMKDDLFEKIASELEQHAPEIIRVHLYRDGEPLIDKKLPQRIRRMKQAGIRKVGISTNAELLDEKRSIAILEAGLDECILSIDSMVPEVFEAIRVGLDFRRVLLNARMFFHYRDILQAPCRVRVRMIYQDSNAHEWDSGEFQGAWASYASERDVIEKRALHNWGGQLKNFETTGDLERPCIALWSLMCIFADGSVPMCNVDFNKKHGIGNVRESTIAELWQGRAHSAHRKAHLNKERNAIDICKDCTVWSEYRDTNLAVHA